MGIKVHFGINPGFAGVQALALQDGGFLHSAFLAIASMFGTADLIGEAANLNFGKAALPAAIQIAAARSKGRKTKNASNNVL
jgi:hypothetical protein